MGKTFIRALLLTLFAAFLLLACSEGAREKAVQPSSGDPVLSALGGTPYEGEPLYMVGSRAVTEEELKRYGARMLSGRGMAGHGGSSVDNVVREFARYWSVIALGVERGLHRLPEVADIIAIYRDSALAADFRDHLKKTLVPPAKKVEALIHDEWVRVDFSVKKFPTMEEAESFYEGLEGNAGKPGTEGYEEFVERNFTGSTGLIFKGSGFFDPFDEQYLFGLKEGEISKPVKTGIGAGLCYVRKRVDMDEEAVSAYIEEEKEKLVEEMIAKKFGTITGGLAYTIHEKELDEAVRQEGESGEFGDQVILTIHAGKRPLKVRYRDLRSMIPANYFVYFRQYPAESWANIVVPDLKKLAQFYAIGEEAAKQGVALQEKWAKEMFDFTLKTVYYASFETLMEEAEAAVGEKEVGTFYEQNRGFFSHGLILKVSYLFAPQAEGLRSLVKDAGAKENLFTDEKYTNLVKGKTISSGDVGSRELFENIRQMKEGQISGIVGGDMGFYIVRVDERSEKGFTPLEDAKERIERYLVAEKKRKKVGELIEERLKGVEIRKL